MKELKAYKIVELKTLLALREAEKAADDKKPSDRDIKKTSSEAESVTVATFPDAEPININKPEAPPATPEAPHTGNNVNGTDDMPESLRGLSALDLSLIEIDSMLTPAEQAFFNKRKGRPIDFSHFGKNAWLAF